jgi:hypothetical protein
MHVSHLDAIIDTTEVPESFDGHNIGMLLMLPLLFMLLLFLIELMKAIWWIGRM